MLTIQGRFHFNFVGGDFLIRGLYTACSGMLAETMRTDTIANNLANTNTTAFKKDQVVFCANPEMNIHRFDDPVSVGLNKIDPKPFIGVLGTGVQVDDVNTNFLQGGLKKTSNPLDVAIRGEGFFEIMTPQGPRFTRDGSFARNSQGYIVTKSGHFLMGENGPIELPQGSDISVSSNGDILVDGQYIDTIRTVIFQNQDQLTKEGDNLYQATEQPIDANADIVHKHIEVSNVNPVREMVDMITAFRAYEANQKAIRTHDETLDKAVNDIARL